MPPHEHRPDLGEANTEIQQEPRLLTEALVREEAASLVGDDSINHNVFRFHSDLLLPAGMSSVNVCAWLPAALFPLFLFGLCGPTRFF